MRNRQEITEDVEDHNPKESLLGVVMYQGCYVAGPGERIYRRKMSFLKILSPVVLIYSYFRLVQKGNIMVLVNVCCITVQYG